MRVYFHGRAEIYPTLKHRVLTSKKTGTHSGVPAQPHSQGHRHIRPAVSTQCLQLSPSKKHEQCPQENHRRGYR